MADASERDLTEGEREEQDETGETADEAHREGEYKELRALIEGIRDEIAGLRGAIADLAVSRPADPEPDEVTDDDGDGLINIDELDL